MAPCPVLTVPPDTPARRGHRAAAVDTPVCCVRHHDLRPRLRDMPRADSRPGDLRRSTALRSARRRAPRFSMRPGGRDRDSHPVPSPGAARRWRVRICLVEIDGRGGLHPACAIPADLVVRTGTAAIQAGLVDHRQGRPARRCPERLAIGKRLLGRLAVRRPRCDHGRHRRGHAEVSWDHPRATRS